VLTEFQDEQDFIWRAGLLLSALINNCEESSFVIHTDLLTQPLDYIGYGNTKNIIVQGDANHCVGRHMKNGTITVRGNAGSFVGEGMAGGVIIVEGNTGSRAGSSMTGGEIHTFGSHIPVISSCFISGKIFHNEDLIA
jgi:glutamate synthase domain-containing protein 3